MRLDYDFQINSRLSKINCRPNRRVLIYLLLTILFVFIFPACNQKEKPSSILKGHIYDLESTKFIANAEIRWKETQVLSNAEGYYQIEVPVGVREISFTSPSGTIVRKMAIVRKPDDPITLDVLLTNSSVQQRNVLALNRGSLVADGEKLELDVSADSPISVTDEYGNSDQLQTIGASGVSTFIFSPTWVNERSILYGKDAVVSKKELFKYLGVFEYDLFSKQSRQIAAHEGIHFIDKSPTGNAICAATRKDIYIIDSPSDSPAQLRRLHGFAAPDFTFISSVLWGADNRIYFTVEESTAIDDRHYLEKSKLASIKSDGTDLQLEWAVDSRYSYAFPARGADNEILFSRSSTDGKEQALWLKNIADGSTRKILDNALRAVFFDQTLKRLYYIYRRNLHYRDLQSGIDLIIANSVDEASYLRK